VTDVASREGGNPYHGLIYFFSNIIFSVVLPQTLDTHNWFFLKLSTASAKRGHFNDGLKLRFVGVVWFFCVFQP
jgi:hypothetical protein